jgi:hypothetical protein
MKKFIQIFCSITICLAYTLVLPAYSQEIPVPSRDAARPELLLSHQMNQPDPEAAKQYKISKKLVDEIRRLYLQAKKEFDSKAEKNKTP